MASRWKIFNPRRKYSRRWIVAGTGAVDGGVLDSPVGARSVRRAGMDRVARLINWLGHVPLDTRTRHRDSHDLQGLGAMNYSTDAEDSQQEVST